MNLNNYFWFFKSVLTSKFCNEVVKYGKQQLEQTALTGSINSENRDFNKNPMTKKELKILKKTRNSNISWLKDRWIYKEIIPYVHKANINANWNFQIDSMEHCQFTKYKKKQFYNWHCDSYKEPFNRPNDILHGKIRKLSVTCSLSDPNEYEGGELEFNFNNPEKSKKSNLYKCKEILPKGSLVVFPSFVYHRVCPVIKGTRHSLVMWNTGNPFI